MKNTNMIAKITAVLFILVLAFALTACGNKAKDDDAKSAAEAETAPEKTVPTAEAVQNVEEQIDNLDTIDQDLDTSDLDALDKELDLQI